ncbi:response regulator transcription factor [Fulvimarina sp. 2208YS6-2-32]|uniref:Response regulator transcription factor n=1 Tax=Fulvimarina uroteuthidis TaxID=3098149 RepID=A0ABU5I1A8_9HYPH|nr:response regulator transcription factor [Fulvimarina sp. 2208YS6-2-32]MDY8107961.1 response regulator transcription factor [Fulvimarina sp. 2208YS6-2-32]
MKILLVEDDALHVAYLEEQVARALPEAKSIIVAGDGAEAEDLARQPDVGGVVMDLQMKRRNGIEAARTIWSERPHTRILFWSNYADEAYLRGIARIVPEDCAYGYVLKTVSSERLHLALRSVLVLGQITIDREMHRIQARGSEAGSSLTDSEYAVLLDLALGFPDKEIALRQGVSLRTVQNRLLSLYDKLAVDVDENEELANGVNKRVRAVLRALLTRTLNIESLESAERTRLGR